VILHVPRIGHSGKSKPLTEQLWLVWTLHVPLTLGHVAAEVQDAKGELLHVPGVGEQSLGPLGQDWAIGVTQVPGVFEHTGPGLQARPLVLHTPGVGEQAGSVGLHA
jgi:hypothetical protein